MVDSSILKNPASTIAVVALAFITFQLVDQGQAPAGRQYLTSTSYTNPPSTTETTTSTSDTIASSTTETTTSSSDTSMTSTTETTTSSSDTSMTSTTETTTSSSDTTVTSSIVTTSSASSTSIPYFTTTTTTTLPCDNDGDGIPDDTKHCDDDMDGEMECLHCDTDDPPDYILDACFQYDTDGDGKKDACQECAGKPDGTTCGSPGTPSEYCQQCFGGVCINVDGMICGLGPDADCNTCQGGNCMADSTKDGNMCGNLDGCEECSGGVCVSLPDNTLCNMGLSSFICNFCVGGSCSGQYDCSASGTDNCYTCVSHPTLGFQCVPQCLENCQDCVTDELTGISTCEDDCLPCWDCNPIEGDELYGECEYRCWGCWGCDEEEDSCTKDLCEGTDSSCYCPDFGSTCSSCEPGETCEEGYCVSS